MYSIFTKVKNTRALAPTRALSCRRAPKHTHIHTAAYRSILSWRMRLKNSVEIARVTLQFFDN